MANQWQEHAESSGGGGLSMALLVCRPPPLSLALHLLYCSTGINLQRIMSILPLSPSVSLSFSRLLARQWQLVRGWWWWW